MSISVGRFKLCLWATIFLTFAGCSARTNELLPEDEARASLALESVRSTYGEVTDPATQRYIKYLETRLKMSFERGKVACDNCSVTLVNTKQVLAFSAGPGTVVISQGLLKRLANEGELAFVIAHEFAHQALGHHASISAADQTNEPEFRTELEREADRTAVGILALAGYDIRVAEGALMHAYSPQFSQDEYPELYTRARLIRDQIDQSNWEPPGTLDRREFQIIRAR